MVKIIVKKYLQFYAEFFVYLNLCDMTGSTFTDCFWMLSALLEFTSHNNMPPVFSDYEQKALPPLIEMPQRMEGNHLHRYSKVIEGHMGTPRSRPLPTCPNLIWAKPHPLNVSASS